MRTGGLGHWWESLGGQTPRSEPLSARVEADVAIVGGGYTGLWCAYYLARADPSLRIVLLERELLGFGASGRNGGWLSGFFSGSQRAYESSSSPAAVLALRRAMFATVEEVAAVLSEHHIDADLERGGELTVALGEAQARRVRGEVARAHANGLGADDLRVVERDELAQRIRVAGASVASFSPHVARVHPAKLLAGLAGTVAALGVQIHERSAALSIEPRRVRTGAGAVSARWVIRATEGYTASLPRLRRVLVPMNSSMIVTEPLPEAVWEEIGWARAEALADAAHVYVYLQRTADGRIAIGGRGVPYRYASRTDGRGDTAALTIRSLRERLGAMFPAAARSEIAHAWSGVLGVPRDWRPTVHADRASGLAWAGGYVGEGVAASNLAARIMRDLVLERESALTSLPWVRSGPRPWEPEPLRYAGIRGLYALYRRADRSEARSGRESRLARFADAVSGRA
jgi:glycine/D-amino acid oxidase-like deaminating enzyme